MAGNDSKLTLAQALRRVRKRPFEMLKTARLGHVAARPTNFVHPSLIAKRSSFAIGALI